MVDFQYDQVKLRYGFGLKPRVAAGPFDVAWIYFDTAIHCRKILFVHVKILV